MGKDELESWFLQGGGTLHASAEIALDSTGLFVRACQGQDILPGSCIVSCPHELTLSWLNAIEGSDPFVDSFNLSSASRFLNKTVITRFFLIKQFQLHEKSYWWPYIHSLPQPDSSDRLSTPMWYEVDDIVWIRGTNLEYAMKMKEQLWRQEYEEALSLLRIGSSNARELYSWFVP